MAKSQAELASLPLITCINVSPVLLELGMPLSTFQLQPLALLQAHAQVRYYLIPQLYLGIVDSFLSSRRGIRMSSGSFVRLRASDGIVTRRKFEEDECII